MGRRIASLPTYENDLNPSKQGYLDSSPSTVNNIVKIQGIFL